jgi:chromosome transmission fidelity protein 4
VSRWEEEGRVDKVIPELTQFLLEKSYEQSQGARFLYYNNVGCVIERCEGGSSTIELDLHDKSRPKRLSLDVKSRPFWLFAIRQDVLVYATTTLVVFQCERHLKEGHEEWEFRWDNIQAVSIGSNWVALCSSDAVKVLDYSGNELHTFCFDRRLVAFEAYEDTLAIVFHSAPPMWGCQALKVRLYRVTPEAVTLERDTLLPLKANSQLKWFGFSEEGMLYSQDSLEVVRAYVFERDEWVALHSMEGSTDRFYIQHISGTEIYGFKLEQKHGKRE